MTEEERLELERLRLGAAGQRASDDYEAMVNAPSNNVNIPSFGQSAPGVIPALPAMPTVDQAAPAMPRPFGFAPTEPLTATERANLLGSQQLDTAVNSGNLKESGVVEIVPSLSLTQGEQADLTEGQMLDRLRLGGARNLSEALNVPMPMTNVGLTGEPLREQPSVDDIIFMSRPDRLASKDLATRDKGFLEGLKGLFTDFDARKLRESERYAPRNQPLDIVPSGNTMRPDTPMLDSVMESGIGPFQPGSVDFSRPATTDATSGDIIELRTLTRNDTPPEATFLRADGSIGEIFPGQRIGDAFPGNPDTPSLGGQVQGVDLPGGVGFVRAPEGMVKTIGPDGRMIFATPEQANAMAPTVTAPTVTAPPSVESLPSKNQSAGLARRNVGQRGTVENPIPLLLDFLQNLDSPGTARGKTSTGVSSDVVSKPPRPSMRGVTNNQGNTTPQVTEIGSSRQLMSGVPGGGPLGPAMFPSGSGTNLPTLSSLNAMSGIVPQGRPALSSYEQASMDREARIGGTGSFAGDSAAREARIAARPDFNAPIRSARSAGQLSQADLRDLAQGSARGATEGERMRALQIQQRAGMGAFKPETPRVDKLSQATSTVDRMIQNGQLSPDKRNAAIQKIMGVDSVGDAGTSADAGIIGSAEFDRISSQLQPGGSLYEQGIRVDPSKTDPLTGAAQVYREKPGLEFGPPAREMVSPELVQQLLPYLRSVRQPNTGDFAGVGMQVNQFAGSR